MERVNTEQWLRLVRKQMRAALNAMNTAALAGHELHDLICMAKRVEHSPLEWDGMSRVIDLMKETRADCDQDTARRHMEHRIREVGKLLPKEED